ncbi:hypothetical protein M3654_23520, partial [Bacillus licheniformis]|nr:hypothetical protein [Bacillus licheniformis]
DVDRSNGQQPVNRRGQCDRFVIDRDRTGCHVAVDGLRQQHGQHHESVEQYGIGFGSLSTGLSDVGTTVASLSTGTAAGFVSLSTSTAQTIGSLSTSTASAIATLSTTTSRSISSLSTGLAGDGATLSAMQSALAAGTVGLVQQAGGAGTGAITIGAST